MANFTVTDIDPTFITQGGFELADQTIIPSFEVEGLFTPGQDTIELYIYDLNKTLVSSEYNFRDWSIVQDPSITDKDKASTIELDPGQDIQNAGFDVGDYYSIYNFIRREFNSSINNTFYISDISGDRTELRLKSNFIAPETIISEYPTVLERLNNPQYFDEFYIGFGNNEYEIVTNIELDGTGENTSVLIKLYEPLPSQYSVKDTVYVISKSAESKAYQVVFEDDFILSDDLIKIKGPNTNLDFKDKINNSSDYQSVSSLLNVSATSSLDQLLSILEEQSTELNIDYTDFSNFIHFSSIQTRIENFYYKVGQIQSFENDLNTLSSVSQSQQLTTNTNLLKGKISDIIKNFDGYEYFLYYESSSYAYPKSGTLPPYTLLPTGSTTVLTWLGNANPSSPFFGGQIYSASLYDEDNQSNLYYTVPEYLRENPSNAQYLTFVEMVSQLFDYLWTYAKYSTQKLQATNNMNLGIPPEMVEDALNSFGFTTYGNNYNSQDNYTAWTGLNPSLGYAPPTGSELITNYIAANLTSSLVNSWDPYGQLSTLTSQSYVYPTDDISKEIYKRLYHNLPQLVKSKGTLAGLRMLINIFGVPDTVLKIREFGGKDKIDTNNWDAFYRRYNYAYKTFTSSSALFPWMPLYKNYIESSQYIVPDTIEFRFKTEGIPTTTPFTQSLLVKKSDSSGTSTDFDFGVFLYYTGSLTSGSYSGSIPSEYSQYGNLRFYISGSSTQGGTITSPDITLPFFDGDWWSVMFRRNQHISASDSSSLTSYTLYAKNKLYEGYDGDQLGWSDLVTVVTPSSGSGSQYGVSQYGSSSYGSVVIVSGSYNQAWNSFGTSSVDGVYLGGFISGSTIGNLTLNTAHNLFSGSFQEFRYYGLPLSEAAFNDYVMDPESIEGMALQGVSSSFDILNFRAPLGNELESIFASTQTTFHSSSFISIHPAILGNAPSLITASFIAPNTGVTSSTYQILFYDNSVTGGYSEPNREIVYQDNPAVGIRGEVDDKIQILSNQAYGTVLSNQISIQQNYIPSQSYSPDVNMLEVGFSPQNEVNDDITQQLGMFNIGELIGDPRQRFNTDRNYAQLDELRDDYFKKYGQPYNIWDYVRLIKYFDNSLFKTLKDFVPARTKMATGIIIKPTLLERQRTTPIQASYEEQIYTGSIQMYSFTGSSAGSMPDLKGQISGSGPGFNIVPITQSWAYTNPSVLGPVNALQSTQDEFYNGEFSGSSIQAARQVLNPDCQVILEGSTLEINYNVTLYEFDPTVSGSSYNWTVGEFLTHANPNQGEIYLWYDSGSTLVNISSGGSLVPQGGGIGGFNNQSA
jgi:hypothetical protein